MRKISSLKGQWDFIPDLDPKYHGDKTIYPFPPYAKPDANRYHWKKVPVPGVWQKYAERYDIFEGVCWFSKVFEVTGYKEGMVSRIRFGAVNYLCRVFLNGEEIGSHETGYTEFVIDTTKHLREGTNHIAVMVDNRATTVKWPPCLGYFNYGGIHRDVTLEILEDAYLDDITINGNYHEDVCTLGISGKVKCINEIHGSELSIEIICDNKKAKIDLDASNKFDLKLFFPDLEPWHPEDPHLYHITLRLFVGELTLDIHEFWHGFKSLCVSNGEVHLNGDPINMKGICYVYDSVITGMVMTKEQIEIDIGLMKEMGCNAVRCHYPMDKNFYEACDRNGMMVWIEPTVYCYHPPDDAVNTAYSNPEWIDCAKQMTIEMIRTAKNHTSVSIYGIGNECNTANPEAKEFFRSIAYLVRQEDPARLLSYAALYGNIGPLADMVDILGINSYWGWYDKIFGGKGLKPEGDEWQKQSNVPVEPIDLGPMRQMLDKAIFENRKDLVLFLTEFGADSVPGFYSQSMDLWSEDYHAEVVKEIFKLSEEYPQIAGTFPFCFSDYRDPSKVSNGYWNELNLKGVVSYDRRKKLVFEIVKLWYGANDIRKIHAATERSDL